MDIITPQRLYHGTTDNYLPSFQNKLLNSQYWRPGRDFGEGFYTTISVGQARKWAYRGLRSSLLGNARACVLEIELRTIPASCQPLIFLSDSLAWAQFIMLHRLASQKGEDPCHQRHPDIIIGPMADSDTGKIIKEAVQLNKDAHWFYEQITRSMRGRRMDSLQLGNQVVFSSESWESALALVGYHIYMGGRWVYHDCSSEAQSL
ncbi:hypothetical protein PAECIP111893_00820 [Paenibacillus plantiphilus]|uniref:DUF3990 domain-containing protein n=1 Tax=Paenibacillus plantiphilus TaxID=2905650 RepID=A0ABN8G7P5_9BACL|nr:DUF3990 domain-containing protein [Paenibacillus plantiphilus]CAH1197562.1 hypothetical protein PAECIP111893_00820 [Paenibacillus plantiphilus]